jgi:hypothetical protein
LPCERWPSCSICDCPSTAIPNKIDFVVSLALRLLQPNYAILYN